MAMAMAWPTFTFTPLELLLSVPCLLFIVVVYYRRRSSKIPVYWPVVGMMPAMVFNLHDLHVWITDLLQALGCNFLFRGAWFSGMNLFITADPYNIQHVFTSNFQNYPKGEEFSEMFDVLGNGIFNADDDMWRSQRVRAQQLISHSRFRAYVAQLSREKTEEDVLPFLAHAAEQGRTIDLQDVCLRLTFDTTTKLVFGVDPTCLSIGLPTVPFARAMDDAMTTLFYRHAMPMAVWKLLRKLNVGFERKLANAWKVMDQFVEDTVSKRRAEKKHGKPAGDLPDLLSSYIDDEEAEKVNQFLRDTTVSLMLAGRDTTGAGLSWFLWLLTQNRHIEQKIVDELNTIPHSVTDGGMAVFNPEDLAKLVYLHAALSEALRLFPPVPFEHKGVVKTDTLPSGHVVTPDMQVFVSIYSMARMEGVWGKDCAEFRPERWITDNSKIKYEPSYKFLSFNTGPRTCLGKDIAFTQMKSAAAAMVYNFSYDVVKGHVVAPKHSIILQMRNGLLVKAKKRASVV